MRFSNASNGRHDREYGIGMKLFKVSTAVEFLIAEQQPDAFNNFRLIFWRLLNFILLAITTLLRF